MDGTANSTPITDLVKIDEQPLEAFKDPVVTDKDAAECFRNLNLSEVSAQNVRNLAKVGIYMKGAGTLKTQRGRAFVTQELLNQTMFSLAGMVSAVAAKKPTKAVIEQMAKLSHEVGFIASKITESQELMIELEGKTVAAGSPVSDSPQPTNATWQPKQKIQPVLINAQNVTVSGKE